jgi:hypothetical protein
MSTSHLDPDLGVERSCSIGSVPGDHPQPAKRQRSKNGQAPQRRFLRTLPNGPLLRKDPRGGLAAPFRERERRGTRSCAA